MRICEHFGSAIDLARGHGVLDHQGFDLGNRMLRCPAIDEGIKLDLVFTARNVRCIARVLRQFGLTHRLRKAGKDRIAIAANHDPSRRMKVVGITGTNGKTTTAHLVASIFEAAGVRCGLLGTVAYRIGNQTRPATRTTPEAPDVQAMLAEMVAKGCGACAMEVSSHALALGRVTYASVGRADNGRADGLVNEALDLATGKK